MRYYKRTNEYKNSTGTNVFCCDKLEAYSYEWWCFFKVIDGVPVFNNYGYSNSTNKHQVNVRQLLRDKYPQLHDKIVWVSIADGLQDFDSLKEIMQVKINNKLEKIEKHRKDVEKPRSHKKKNVERRRLISMLSSQVLGLSEKYNIEVNKNDLFNDNLERSFYS